MSDARLFVGNLSYQTMENDLQEYFSQAGAVKEWDTVDVLIKAGAICQPKEVAGEWWWKECNKRRK